MTAYYNEINPYAAQWLRNLIARGLIASGDVDERSITEVSPDDLRGYEQCHFFAGIGGWSYALRLAGWGDDRPVCTGSCPCQPFSVAGNRRGINDERHLWPEFFRLISERRPPTVFGEQVSSKSALAWLDLVQDDLQGSGYAVGACDLCAACVGAPHIRQRLYYVANANHKRLSRFVSSRPSALQASWNPQQLEGLVQEQIQLSVPTGRFGALSDGVSGRVGRLRAYGNAIVPQVAAEFIGAVMEGMP